MLSLRLAAFLGLIGTLALPASAIAHGYAHHRSSHDVHEVVAQADASSREIESSDESDHLHFDVISGAVSRTSDVLLPVRSCLAAFSLSDARSTNGAPVRCEARAPPQLLLLSDTLPRSPPST